LVFSSSWSVSAFEDGKRTSSRLIPRTWSLHLFVRHFTRMVLCLHNIGLNTLHLHTELTVVGIFEFDRGFLMNSLRLSG
jgi:hypothetical protein